ncbi:hypothetical protein EJ04DRAFT_260684 [Polyplosphaeria fusca]|uniref:Uncharacterized protein n=1 Tax=Polyplosphaeria fusca TaxID=682080 RepID=A0A9P4RAR0_9PLEO|nr:hypothetical protein EJ04DRAFT_260684 [Polyplosphaeria fusca]
MRPRSISSSSSSGTDDSGPLVPKGGKGGLLAASQPQPFSNSGGSGPTIPQLAQQFMKLQQSNTNYYQNTISVQKGEITQGRIDLNDANQRYSTEQRTSALYYSKFTSQQSQLTQAQNDLTAEKSKASYWYQQYGVLYNRAQTLEATNEGLTARIAILEKANIDLKNERESRPTPSLDQGLRAELALAQSEVAALMAMKNELEQKVKKAEKDAWEWWNRSQELEQASEELQNERAEKVALRRDVASLRQKRERDKERLQKLKERAERSETLARERRETIERLTSRRV